MRSAIGSAAARIRRIKPSDARTAILATSGFGMLTAAAWTLGLGWGLAAGGLSLLILEALGGDR